MLEGTGCDTANTSEHVRLGDSDTQSHIVKPRMTNLFYLVSVERHLRE